MESLFEVLQEALRLLGSWDREVMEIVGPVMQEALKAVLRGWDTPKEAAASAIESLGE